MSGNLAFVFVLRDFSYRKVGLRIRPSSASPDLDAVGNKGIDSPSKTCSGNLRFVLD